ncbi:MAG: cupredoxin domain-containing protein [Acidimicrobiales bacterium]
MNAPRLNRSRPTAWVMPLGVALALVSLASCGSDDSDEAASGGGGASTSIDVSSGAKECTLSAVEAPAGKVTFSIKNDGSETTEFYVYDAAGTKVITEVENIGPGLSRELSVDLAAGTYTTACKPGMKGDGIRAPFTVTSGATADSAATATTGS